MKIGEAIDMIIEDKDLKFVSGGEELYYHNSLGIVMRNAFEGTLYSPDLTPKSLNKNWTTISDPVSFMKASQSAGKIKVNHRLVDTKIFSGYYHLRYLMEKLSDYHSTSQIREILRTGEFYIKQGSDNHDR